MKLARLALHLYRVVEDNHFRYARFLARRGWAAIGENTSVNPWVVFTDWGRTSIGRDCSIGMFAEFITHSGSDRVVRLRTGRDCDTRNSIVVGDRVSIGSHAQIIGPVRIGDDCTIGAGAVVTRDVPSGTFVASPRAVMLGPIEEFDRRQLVRHVRERVREAVGVLPGAL